MIDELRPHNIHDIEPPVEPAEDVSVSVVIPVYNRSELVQNTIQSLAVQDGFDNYELIVADDGSDEDIKSAVEGLDVTYMRQEKMRFGAGRARNLGCSVATGDVVIFVDSDCLVKPDFVARHARWHEPGTSRVVIGARTHAVMGSDDDLVDYRKRLNRRTSNLRFGTEIFRSLITANVSMPLWLFHEVGGFDERFHRWGGEDTELGWRLWSAGATFIDDEDNSVTHQLDKDPSGGAEGRERSRALNRGLMASLIPHRFYRPGPPATIPVVPKVSVIAHDVPGGTATQTWQELQEQPRSDFELIVVADFDAEEPMAGASAGEPRLSFADDLARAVELAKGEYVCFLNGHAALGRQLLTEMIKRLDQQPFMVTGTVGYRVDGAEGGSIRSEAGAADIDAGWGETMPVCWFVRNRELVKLRLAGIPTDGLWKRCRDYDLNIHWHSAAVRLPGATRRARPSDFSHMEPSRRQLVEEIVANPKAVGRVARTYLARKRGRQAHSPSESSNSPAKATGGSPQVSARYVGWTGKYNLGDEVMLGALRQLMPWADIRTEGEAGKLLLLGGGTLINRFTYLKWLMHRDTPRAERAVIGTGVASPEYWGLREEPKRWIDWLQTCVYVGVRGPHSYDVLREWGFKGEMEVCGDSALLIERPPHAEKVPGRIVAAPAWTKGELWGGSDESVVGALSSATSLWLEEGREVAWLSSSPDDDGQVLKIMERVEHGVLPFVQGYSDHQAALHLIASADVVVGERLHACILAAAVGTPFVPIEYRPKLRDFAASVDAEHLVIRTDQISGQELNERMHEALDTDMDKLRTRVDGYRRALRAAAARIERATIG